MKKRLGYFAALSLVVGNIIGVGIFTTTGFMAQYIHSPLLILSAWLLGAFYAISGAIVYGILVRHYPLSGGDYQYLCKAAHPLAGYMFGWSCFFVTYSGSIAALSIGAAMYLDGLFGFFDFQSVVFAVPFIAIDITLAKLIAILLILIFTWINYRGILLSANYQIILTASIFVFLLVFSGAGIFSAAVDFSYIFYNGGTGTTISGFFTALLAVLFAYMGWTTAVYVAEEINRASKIIPRVLLHGVLLVGFVYIWTNLVYVVAVPVPEMENVVNIATLVSTKLWGSTGNTVISAFIFIAILSSLNSTVLSGPRIYMAMGRDNYIYGITKSIHPKYDTPTNAIVLQAVWCIFLVLSGSFNQLLSFVVFVAIIFSIIAAFIGFNIKPRSSFQTVAILFYVAFCSVILINTLWQRPGESVIGVILVVVAIPIYYLEKRRKFKTEH
jgi:APA family basic amino acid/polyamine antiporter